jgi:hypothetical protein
MSTIRSMVWVGVAAGAASVLTLNGAAAQSTCEWYGRHALKQQQENAERKCAFVGPEWSLDIKAHMTWCASVAPDVWKKAAQKRDQDLAACALKKPS